jgi:hypothetical protein
MAVRFHPSVFIRHRCDRNGYQAAPKKANINVEFQPADNCYLIVHESSGLDSQTGDSQDLQTIRDFISHRTDPSRLLLPPERLHAIWLRSLIFNILDY